MADGMDARFGKSQNNKHAYKKVKTVKKYATKSHNPQNIEY